MNDEKYLKMITDRLAGELPPEEQPALDAALAAEPELAKHNEAMKELWGKVGSTLAAQTTQMKNDAPPLYLDLDAIKREAESLAVERTTYKKKRLKVLFIELAAACVILAIGVIFTPAYKMKKTSDKCDVSAKLQEISVKGEEAGRIDVSPSSSAADATRRKQTASGRMDELEKNKDGKTKASAIEAVNLDQLFPTVLQPAPMKKSQEAKQDVVDKEISLSEHSGGGVSPKNIGGERKKIAEDQTKRSEADKRCDAAVAPLGATDKLDLAKGKAPAGQLRKNGAEKSNVVEETAAAPVSELKDEKGGGGAGGCAKRKFHLNLKLWELTTNADVKAFLARAMGTSSTEEVVINVDKEAGTIELQAAPAILNNAEELFNNLNKNEEKRKNKDKGLPFLKTRDKPFSTFSTDDDAVSYITAKKAIFEGKRPDPASRLTFAYQTTSANLIPKGSNRVVAITDGIVSCGSKDSKSILTIHESGTLLRFERALQVT